MKVKKQEAETKIIYHAFFCGDNIGEADGFFEIKNGKLQLVDGWSANDAQWRGEYMSGLLEHFGVKVERLPKNHVSAAEKLLEKAWGL